MTGGGKRDLPSGWDEDHDRHHQDPAGAERQLRAVRVLDKNGTDGEAKFSLPLPGSYTIWARALGAPGDSAKITTCATDITGSPAAGDICRR